MSQVAPQPVTVRSRDDRTLVGGEPSATHAARHTPTVRHPLWIRFLETNKAFCRRRLRPRLYLVTGMAALEHWFRSRTAKVPPGASLLEFGCERTFWLTSVIGERFAVRCATDIQHVAEHEVPEGVIFRPCTPDAIPFEDGRFNVVALRSVIEHLENPERTFAELARVMKPGGLLLMNLPNRWDYVSVIARVTGRFKSRILKHIVRTGWEDFPVTYRCNTRRRLTQVADRSGFSVDVFLPLPMPPSYLEFFVPLYLLGAMYQFVISICALDALQPSFVVLLRKRAEPEADTTREPAP